MNKVEVKFSDECGSTTFSTELSDCHISYYIDAFVRALLAEGFQQGSIDRYIPEFDIGYKYYRELEKRADESN